MATAVMGAVQDPDLPVRVQAAITLPELARYEKGKFILFYFVQSELKLISFSGLIFFV